MKTTLPILIFICFSFQSNAQRILVEEFTNIQFPIASESSEYLDSLIDADNRICVIRYHTDSLAGDPFSEGVSSNVNGRINRVGGIENFPTTIVDGVNRPTGDLYDGATLNTTSEYLDSIYNAKQKTISFFGLALNFSDDFKELLGSSGVVLTNSNTSLSVKHYRALVEKVVDADEPLGPNGQTRFNHVFRGWIANGIGHVIPGNGSYHGWSRIDIPTSVKNLNNLHMVVFVTNLSGQVLDCTMASAGPAPSYALSSTNITGSQQTLCDSIVVPRIRVKNTGVNAIEGVAIRTTIGDSTYLDFRADIIQPAEEKTFLIEERTMALSRGTHFIDVSVDYILNAPGQGSFSSSNAPVRYMVGRAHNWEDVGFEDIPDGTFGPITIRAQVDEALKIVDSTDIGSNVPVGAYGLSDHSLMIDCWTWDWDEDDGGQVSNIDNKNFAYLYFDHFPLDHIKQPILKFDVASANKPNHKCIEVAGRPWTCTRNPRIMKTLTGNDILSTTANITSRYTPKPEDWRTYTTDLYYFNDSKQTHLRLKFTNHVDFTRPNAFYIDNIRIESNERVCGDGDLILRSQAEVDSFLLRNTDCNTINGDLWIGSQDSLSDIKNLEGLQNINTVNGALRIINNPILEDAAGLSRLREIHGVIEIVNNDSLRTLQQVPIITNSIKGYLLTDNKNLEIGLGVTVDTLNGSIQILDNPNLRGFPITSVSILGDVQLSGCPMVGRLASSYPLENVKGDIILSELEHWNGFWGFNNLTFVQNNLVVQNCGISGFYGLHNIDTIMGDFILQGNNNLEQISSLHSLRFLGGQLKIKNNNRLKGINQLDSIPYENIANINSSMYDIELTENDSLQLCNSELFCRLVSENDKTYNIQNNGMGCNSPVEVSQSCWTTSTKPLKELKYLIYPNPFEDQLIIQVDEKVQVVIYSVNGRVLFRNVFNPGKHEIELQDLSPGMYFVKMGNEVIEKVIKN